MMALVNTQDLSKSALDYAVAKARGDLVTIVDGNVYPNNVRYVMGGMNANYSGNPSLAIEILDDAGVSTAYQGNGLWLGAITHGVANIKQFEGGSLIQAGLRAFVYHHLGDVVDIPDMLMNDSANKLSKAVRI